MLAFLGPFYRLEYYSTVKSIKLVSSRTNDKKHQEIHKNISAILATVETYRNDKVYFLLILEQNDA